MSKHQIEKKLSFRPSFFPVDIRGERRMRTNWPESFSVEIISLASLVSGAKKPLVTRFFSAIPEAIYMVSDVALSALGKFMRRSFSLLD